MSALTTRGLCADVLRLTLVEHEMVTVELVLEEVERTLREKFRMPSDLVAADLTLLRRHSVQPTAPAPKSSPIPDEDDARILATALAAGADVLIAGDRDFLDVRDRIQAIIVTDPRGFWEMHRRGRLG